MDNGISVYEKNRAAALSTIELQILRDKEYVEPTLESLAFDINDQIRKAWRSHHEHGGAVVNGACYINIATVQTFIRMAKALKEGDNPLEDQVSEAHYEISALKNELESKDDTIAKLRQRIADLEAPTEPATPQPEPIKWLTVKEYAAKHNKARSTVYGYVKDDKVQYTQEKDGCSIRIADAPPKSIYFYRKQ